jgi:hypothetical protein
MRRRHVARGIVLAAFGLVLIIAPRLRTEPATTPEVLTRPAYGMPVNNGYPALARGPNGEIWLAWVSRRTRDPRRFGSQADLVQYDQIFLKRRDASGWSKELRVSPDVALDFDPAIAPDADGAWVIWSRRERGHSHLMARHIDSTLHMDVTAPLTQPAAADAAPRAATAPDGSIWLTFESYKEGHNGIYVLSRQGAHWSAPERISDPGSSAYRPAISVSVDGTISVAWDGGAAERYGVFLRQRLGPRWTEIRRIPSTGGLDAYAPRVAAGPGGQAWIGWAQNPAPAAEWGLRGWNPGAPPRPFVRAALWTGDRWEGMANAIADNADMPEILLSTNGAVQVILTRLKSHLNFRLWESHLVAAGWSEPRQLDVNEEEYQHIPFPGGPKARIDQRPAAVTWGNRVLLAYERGTGWGENRQIALREFAAPSESAPTAGYQRIETHEPPPFQTAREPHSVDGYQVYFGDIHTHLLMDDGWTGTADQFYAFARDRRKLDFAAYTPHAESNKLLGSEVALVERIAAQFNQPGRFIGIPGWEWTQGDFKVPQEGHKHVLNETEDQQFFSALEADSDNSKELTRLMKGTTGIMFAHHVARGATGGTNFDTIDTTVEPDVEITSHWGRFEFFGNPGHTVDETPGSSVQDGWRRGLHLGVVGGSDNHDLFMERGTALTAVLSDRLDRHAIFEALRRRRCYATTGEKILLDVRVNGAPMGSIIRARGAPLVSVHVTGTDVLQKVEIVKFWKSAPNPFPTVYAVSPDGRQASFQWKDLQFEGDAAYYVRVSQRADPRIANKKSFGSATSFPNEMAWSSPIWVTK